MTDDQCDIIIRLNEACIGHPFAKIAWPHRVLHDAAQEIEALRAQVARLEEDLAFARRRA